MCTGTASVRGPGRRTAAASSFRSAGWSTATPVFSGTTRRLVAVATTRADRAGSSTTRAMFAVVRARTACESDARRETAAWTRRPSRSRRKRCASPPRLLSATAASIIPPTSTRNPARSGSTTKDRAPAVSRWGLGAPHRGRELYEAGHIPGAAFLDVDEDLAGPPREGRHPLPRPEAFADAASRAGIGAGVYVVVYGSMGGAERLWWLLRHFGHDDCAVLLGGIDVWGGRLAAGGEEIEPADFVPRERE